MSFFRAACLPLIVSLSLMAGCSSEAPRDYRADVLDVVSADTLVLDVDDERRTVRLAGVVTPQPGDCLADEALEAVEWRVEGPTSVQVRTVGVDAKGTPLVAVDWQYDRDLATTMVEEGLAVADYREADLPRHLATARDQALDRRQGFFRTYDDCTFAARFESTIDAVTDAVARPVPTASSATLPLTEDLLTVLALAEATQEFAREAHRDLRLLAYPPARLTSMTTELTQAVSAAKQRLRETRTLRRQLVRQERRARIRLERARQRRRQAALERQRRLQAQQWQQHSHSEESTSTGSSSGSGGAYPGYTGPRCYEPGGQVWHPC